MILRETRYKEADKILTILTEDEGKITAKARGALRQNSKLAAETQLLTFSELTLFGHRGMWTINEATAVEQFLGLRRDIERLALGSYIAELLEAVSDEDSPEPAILQLGLNALYALSAERFDSSLVKAAFELRLMCLSGYAPDLSACSACGTEELDRAWFSPETGELLCGSCRRPDSVELRPAMLDAMRYIIGCDRKRLCAFTLDDQSARQLGQLCERYALTQLERPFASLTYYKNIKR